MTSIEKARENFNQIPDFYLAIVAGYVNDLRHGQHPSTANNETSFDFAQPHLKPLVKNTYPIFILQYGLLAVFAVLSNIAVLAYILRLRLFYDSTHAFVVNLAICHIAQCVITLPITLMVTIIQNWIFGNFLCFFLPFLQNSKYYYIIKIFMGNTVILSQSTPIHRLT
uniref:CSON008356 protein n=1 Tax=Culicoides sonorensis TaxID=179676 RepID=A0A336MVP9_CULSO